MNEKISLEKIIKYKDLEIKELNYKLKNNLNDLELNIIDKQTELNTNNINYINKENK